MKNWFAYYNRLDNQENIQQMTERVSKSVQGDPEAAVGHNIASVGSKLLSGMGYLDATAQTVHRKLTGSSVPIDYNTTLSMPGHYTRTVRNSTSEAIEKGTEGLKGSNTPFGNLYSKAYDLGMDMTDRIAVIGLTALGMPIVASTALSSSATANDAMQNAIARGATDEQAVKIGFVTAAVDMAMEKLSIESLLEMKDPKTATDFFLNMMKQGGVQGSERLLTSTAHLAADTIVMGDKSELNISKQRYEEMGFEPEEASKLAKRDFGQAVLIDTAEGILSGGIMSVGKMGIDAVGKKMDEWDGWDNFDGYQWQTPYGQLQPATAGGWMEPSEQNGSSIPGRDWQATNGADFYIGRTTGNEPFVGVDTDILAGVPEKDQIKKVKDELRKNFPNGIDLGNNEIQIDKQSREEMTFSKYMQWAKDKNKTAYADKLRATNHAEEVLQATTDWINEALKHPRKDNIVEFARGKVLLKVGPHDYSAEVVVGKRANGRLLLYDILELIPTKIVQKR